MKTLDFSTLQLQEIPFDYEGVSYVLREASAGAAKTFSNARTNRMTYGPNGGLINVKDGGDLKPLLVSLCLLKKDDKGNLVGISQSVIEKWPDRVVDQLFDTTKEISNIDQPQTLEQVDERITALQELREELLKDKEDPTKNS